MKTDKQINARLNQVLKLLLTGINQYFLHSRMLENWGFNQLKSKNSAYSIKLMKESDVVIKRILFLEGLPNLQDLGSLEIGTDVPETLAGNLKFEATLRQCLVEAIELCEAQSDFVSRDSLTDILEASESQIDWLESQEYLLLNLGLENYLQSAI
jgi:bacterioferritin